MAVANPDYLYELAEDILTASEGVLTDNGVTLPSRRAIWPGEIVDECDQLAVTLSQIYSGSPGNPVADPERGGYVRTAQYIIRIVRCLESLDEQGRGPSDEEINADSLVAYTDIWVLFQGLIERYAAKTFLSSCQGVLFSLITPVGPQGGLGGWAVTIDIEATG